MRNYVDEAALHKQIRAAAKQDRRTWLESTLAGGSWSAVRRLRKKPSTKPVQIKNDQGLLVDSSTRGDTMADYFENVQWKVSFPDLVITRQDKLGDDLHVKCDNFDMDELRTALFKLATGKSGGNDGIPPDFWKVMLQYDDAMATLLDLCQTCWNQKNILENLRIATVVLLFKKGDTALPSNYRPISLLPVGYKVLAWMVQKRLQLGGAEERIRATQFGFRPKKSSAEAVAVIRRIFDAAYSAGKPGTIALFLDWAKAFDRIKIDSLMAALRRFGVPEPFLQLIGAIYDERFFILKDPGGNSSQRRQRAGIAQGCPLSPYLFILVQTVLLSDVDDILSSRNEQWPDEPPHVICSDILYADDTVLLSSNPNKLQMHLDILVEEGAKYGLELNWDKTVVINIHSEADLMQPSGNKIKKVDRVVYLGSILVSSASAEPELSRRLGEANGSFKTLDACWKHTNIKTERKIQIYLACVVSKLMYCLDSLWLLQGDIQRLDGFHAKCLRRILKIEPSYVSRVSNDFVLKSANQDQLSVLLKKRQNELFQKIASKDDNDLLRRLTFYPSCTNPIVWRSIRRRGRPKLQWAHCMYSRLHP